MRKLGTQPVPYPLLIYWGPPNDRLGQPMKTKVFEKNVSAANGIKSKISQVQFLKRKGTSTFSILVPSKSAGYKRSPESKLT